MRAWLLATMLWFVTAVAMAGPPSWRTAPDTTVVAEALQAELPAIPAEWVHYTDPYATVYVAPEDAATGLRLSRSVARSLPRVSEEMGLPIGNRIHIYVAPTQDAFFEMQPGTAPDWADGTAYPHRGVIFLRSPRVRGGMAEPLEQVLDHELAHILLGRAFGARPVPRWLQEGVAQLVAREYTIEVTDRIGAGMFGDDLLSLEELSAGFPDEPIRAQLAYAQSADFVAFLLNQHGQEALHSVINQMSGGTPFAAAIRNATGVHISTLDAQWRQRLSSSSMLWLRPLVSDTMILGMAGLIFLVLGAATLRRRRIQLQEMEDDEMVDARYAQLRNHFPDLTFPAPPRFYPYPSPEGTSAPEGHRSIHGPH